MKYLITITAILILTSCTTTKKLNVYKNAFNEINDQYTETKKNLLIASINIENLNKQITTLNKEIDTKNEKIASLEKNNNNMINVLETLHVVNEKQTQNIKTSLEYINNIQKSSNLKDSLNIILVKNIKAEFINDTDIHVIVEKSAIFIDIADKILFKSGSYTVSDNGKNIINKVSIILKKHNLEFVIEGHTDNIPFQNGLLLDNIDLSTKRAASVARILLENGVDQTKMTIAGRSEFKPVDTNETEEGRAKNRRTRIILIPQIDEFLKLTQK